MSDVTTVGLVFVGLAVLFFVFMIGYSSKPTTWIISGHRVQEVKGFTSTYQCQECKTAESSLADFTDTSCHSCNCHFCDRGEVST